MGDSQTEMPDSQTGVDCSTIDFASKEFTNDAKYACIFDRDEIRANNSDISLNVIEETIVAKQKILFEKVNEFNKAYSCYVRKNYNEINSNYALEDATKYSWKCENDVDYLEVLQGQGESGGLALEIQDLEADIIDLKNSIDIGQEKVDRFPDPPSDINTLQSLHNRIKRDRNDLDTKVKELNEGSNTSAKLAKLELDTTVYFSLLWTTLAGCIIFYSLSEL